jgi:predicted SPOUT superfamily RNA methylase MTH1
VPRQDLTGADRTWAERYEAGDVLRYSRASKETEIGKGEYAQVKSIEAPANRITVELQDGTERTYDPRRQSGVSVYREEMRRFSVETASSLLRLPMTSELRTASWASLTALKAMGDCT